MADGEHGSVRDLGQDLVEETGVLPGTPRIGRRRRRAESGQVEHDRIETTQRRLEIVAITTPAVQTDHAGRTFAQHIAEQTTVREGAQHGPMLPGGPVPVRPNRANRTAAVSHLGTRLRTIRQVVGAITDETRVPAPPAPPAPPGTGYRPHLDGMRALAVYLVVLFHAGVARFSGGFIGVDMFFVLSGYLVTQLLMRDIASFGTIRFARFYARRIRRLLPASVVALVVTGLVYSAVAVRTDVASAANAFKAAFLYVANWFFIHRSAGYFATGTDTNPVVHFWSLAVEEQFYFVWPILLAGLFAITRRMRNHSHRTLQVIVVVGALLSVSWALKLSGADFNHAYYGTDTRAYELLAGAFLALTPGLAVRAARTGASRRGGRDRGRRRGDRGELARQLQHDPPRHRDHAGHRDPHRRDRERPRRPRERPPLRRPDRLPRPDLVRHVPVALAGDRDHPRVAAGHQSALHLLHLGTRGDRCGLAQLSHRRAADTRWESSWIRVSPLVIATGIATAVVAATLVVPHVVEVGSHRSAVVASAGAGPILLPVGNLNLASAQNLPVDLENVPFLKNWNCEGQAVSTCTIVKGTREKVLIIGDSNAWMMFPTFAKIAEQQHLALSTEATGGCPWQIHFTDPNPAPDDPDRIPRCIAMKKDLYQRVLPALKPDLIVAIANDYLVRRPGLYYDDAGHVVRTTSAADFRAQFHDGHETDHREAEDVHPEDHDLRAGSHRSDRSIRVPRQEQVPRDVPLHRQRSQSGRRGVPVTGRQVPGLHREPRPIRLSELSGLRPGHRRNGRPLGHPAPHPEVRRVARAEGHVAARPPRPHHRVIDRKAGRSDRHPDEAPRRAIASQSSANVRGDS